MSQENLTLVAIDFKTHNLTRRALEHTLKRVKPKHVLVISDQDILPGSQWIEHEPTATFKDYNELMLKGVGQYIETSHALYMQYDGVVQYEDRWSDEFLNYDYIGAVWPWEPEGRNVGNGGFSLRSKRLLDACMDDEIQLSAARNFIAEDATLAIDHRPLLESKYDIKFAPSDVARKFSFELEPSEAWGFHGLWNVFGHFEIEDIDYYMDNLSFSGWNIYLWHHVIVTMAGRLPPEYAAYTISKLWENNPELTSDLHNWIAREAVPNQVWLMKQLSSNQNS